MAVLNNDINEVKKLLGNEIYVDQPDEYDRTALHLASYYNHREIAEELLINGADFYKEDFLKCSALDYAERNKSWATVDILLYCCKLTKRRLMFKRNKLIVLNENLTHPNYGISAYQKVLRRDISN
ncbi:hypothetical protein ANN_00694 [Periplaneta americana]|uniref:Uncharacterized protein n=1 Tax=Periplaneta americana TaxID=6978 RepID=A0ABQ8TTX3_PERAM|nr:hypothetical protein ANN_00694 [Periplaneta americana]